LTLRIALRMRERNVTLCARCFSACRAAFSADLVFATPTLLKLLLPRPVLRVA
jgi:hypothetical protein